MTPRHSRRMRSSRSLPNVVLQQQADLLQAGVQGETVSLRKGLLQRGAYPFQELGVFLGQRIQDAVHRLEDQCLLVQFDLVVGELAEFAGEGFQRPLEEAVDGADGKGAVVVEQFRQPPFRAGIGLREFREVLQDPVLHLGGGFVGEGNGQDVAVPVRRPVLQQQLHVMLGEVVGLSRPGAGFQDLHRPQMFLKSHQAQDFVSCVRRQGFSRSEISASRSASRPSIRSRKRRLSETFSTSRMNRRAGW